MSGTNELIQFLDVSQREDVKIVALQHVLSLTATTDGQKLLGCDGDCMRSLFVLLNDSSTTVVKNSLLTLVNLCGSNVVCDAIIALEESQKLLTDLLLHILKDDKPHRDIACSVLANFTRNEAGSEFVTSLLSSKPCDITCEKLVFLLCQQPDSIKANVDHIASALSNMTQLKTGRLFLLNPSSFIVQQLLPLMEYKSSLTRRGGIIGAIRNCCFETGSEFAEEEMLSLPEELQYLEPDRDKESDPDLRRRLVEAVNLQVKEKNAYLVMRELHAWEQDMGVKSAVEQLIQVLIGDEPEPGMENLNEVVIPEKVEQVLNTTVAREHGDVGSLDGG